MCSWSEPRISYKLLYNNYPLAPDKIKTKREMLSEYQLKIADLYNMPISNVKKLVPKFFDKEKSMIHYENKKLESTIKIKKKYISY